MSSSSVTSEDITFLFLLSKCVETADDNFKKDSSILLSVEDSCLIFFVDLLGRLDITDEELDSAGDKL